MKDATSASLFEQGRQALEHKQPARAYQAFMAYVAACPGDTLGWLLLAQTCRALRLSFQEAQCLDRAIALSPEQQELHELRLYCSIYLGQREEVQTYFERMLQLSPAGAQWLAAQPAQLRQTAAANRHSIQYQYLLAALSDPALSDEAIFAFAAALPGQDPQPLPEMLTEPLPAPPARALRLGYLSRELGTFSSAQQVWLLLKHHSSAVSLYAYDDTPPPRRDAAFKAHFAHWRDVHGLDNRALAEQIRADGIDVLLDLGGITNAARNGVYAYQPAPVQIGGLGFGFSACHRGIEYHFDDPIRYPPGAPSQAPATVVHLSTFFHWQPPEAAAEPGEPPSLHKGFITFGCSNTLNKLNPRVLTLWSRILHALPQARLYLKTPVLGDAQAQAYWYEIFAGYGIGPERLRFAGHRDRPHMAEFYPEIDIALDPFPYQGGVTSCEALWMGVPLLTLVLPPWRTRCNSPTILSAMGLADWICHSEQEYLQRALAWATDPVFLIRMRGELRTRLRQSQICDGPAVVNEIEAACLRLWQGKQARREQTR